MKFMKRVASISLAVCIMAGICLYPVQAEAEKESPWTAADFVIEGDTVFGFSQQGINKLQNSGDIVLPTVSAQGVPVTKVGSFAFLHNKKTAIPEYTSREGESGVVNNLDVDGNEIRDIGEDFNAGLLHSVTIPEGYTYIGSDAFSENTNLKEVTFPDSVEKISEYAFAHMALEMLHLPKKLKTIRDQAFFDNQIAGVLELPEQMQSMGERAFKSNQITDIQFKGEQIKVIREECFQDNRLTSLTIPLSIEKIEEGAFADNPGDENYGSIVVLWTADKTNPHQLTDQGIYINPSDEKKTTPLDIDYSHWENKDFRLDGNVVKGFSELGKLKVKKNKTVQIPGENNGTAITEIAADAFRNIDFEGSTLRKYDIEEVTLPDSIEKIGAFAFQSNNLTEFTAGEHLLEIGQGAFMNNKIESLILNDDLKFIDDAAFHLNQIQAIVIPENVEKIGNSAFRQNGASYLLIMGSRLKQIQEMAFLSNALEEVDLSSCENLTSIDVQAFADNRISDLSFPENLQQIREEAFHANRLETVSLPEKISYVAFNAFDENPGSSEADGKVLITIPGGNIQHVPDGANFIVNKEQLADTKEDLKKLLEQLQEFDQSGLRDSTKLQYQDMISQGRELLEKSNLREGEKLKYIHDTKFFLGRANLDQAIQKAGTALEKSRHQENKKLLQRKYDAAVKAYNNAALPEQSVRRLEKELQFLTDLVEHKGAIAEAVMAQGHYELNTPLPIPPYHIGVNVYFDTSGKILYVLDMSETIGEGQKDAYGNDILNVDEDNAGYHMLALETLDDYEGLDVASILANDVDSIGAIRKIDKAPYHRMGFYEAVRDAAKDAETIFGQHTPDEQGSTKQPISPGDRVQKTKTNSKQEKTAIGKQEKTTVGSEEQRKTTPAKPEESKSVVNTGDNDSFMSLVFLLLLSGSLMCAIIFRIVICRLRKTPLF